MGNIKLLDCTLRDGGYINDWNFGKAAIVDIKEELEKSNTEIIELGFIRDEFENEDRSIFTDIQEVKDLIGNKLPNREYAIMTEVSNPYPLDKLEPYSDGAPDIIRVIVWKRMLQEGFEYCKGIVEKGYKLCVQPARVSQYSDEEFVDMLNLFSQLNPYAIYVVDSWGTMYKDELLHYLKLADENLKPGISVGYHGHNNLMQAFEVACAFCEQDLKRDLIIDASVYGIGRGAGNLNSELFAKWMNEKHHKDYKTECFTKIYDKYISKIYLLEKWGYSVPFEITAKYNCNPNFANYYEKLKVPNEVIEEAIKLISPEERIIFDDKKAMNALRQANKNKWNKTLGIIIVTSGRPKSVEGNLRVIAKACYNYGIDVIVYDSSSDDETKKVTEEFAQKYDNIIYDKWEGVYDGVSIDNKVLDAYRKYSSKYKYIWQTRDGVAIAIDYVLPNIEPLINKGQDIIIVDQDFKDFKHYGSKDYDDCALLFKEQCSHLQTLGTFIVKNEFILDVMDKVKLDDKTYGLYCPIAFYYYWAKNKLKASSWVGSLWQPMSGVTPTSSFWTRKILYQWGERWFLLIDNLPSIYDKYKEEVLLIETYDFKPFTLKYLIKAKEYGGLTVSLINKYKEYIKHVSRTPLWKFYVVAILPSFISKKIYKMLERTDSLYNYNLPKKNNVKRKIMNYEQNRNCFELTKNVKSNLLYGSQDKVKDPYITVFIPTYKRLNLLKEAIDSVLKQQEVNFEWNIIIVDNEPYNGVANATEKYVRKLDNEKITYYRNDKNLRPGDNFNRGFYLAKAPWVMMLHDDDLLLPNALSKMAKSIEYLSANDKKELGAITTFSHQFAYDPQNPEACLPELDYWTQVYMSKPMSYEYYKLTHSNVLLNSNIGGGSPTCGATYNRKAVLEVGGFNDDLGISADLILYYCLENNYSVYSTLEPYGFYRWGANQMAKKENAYKVIRDNFDFREYVYSKNLFNKIFGWLFRDSHYYSFTKIVLGMRKVITADSIEFYDYADIYNKKPGLISYTLYKLVIQKIYNIRKRVQTKMIRKKIKKYVKNKNKKELNNAANK